MRGVLAALAGIWLIWGYNWTLMKVVSPYTGPWEFVAARGFAISVIMVPLMLALRRSLALRPAVPLVLIGLFQGAGMNGLAMAAVWFGSASKATILTYTMPFWTVLFARLFLHEPIRRSQWFAIALAAIGLYLILSPHHATLGAGIGDFLAIGAGMSWALGTIVTKWTNEHAPIDPLAIVTWQSVIGMIPLAIAALLIREPPMTWNAGLIGFLLYATILSGIVAWLLWMRILERVSAATAGMSALAIPVIGIVSAYAQLGERPQPLQWVGMLTILAALAIITAANVLRGNAADGERFTPDGQPLGLPGPTARGTSSLEN